MATLRLQVTRRGHEAYVSSDYVVRGIDHTASSGIVIFSNRELHYSQTKAQRRPDGTITAPLCGPSVLVVYFFNHASWYRTKAPPTSSSEIEQCIGRKIVLEQWRMVSLALEPHPWFPLASLGGMISICSALAMALGSNSTLYIQSRGMALDTFAPTERDV
jgi:hypothetical protein